MSDPGASSNAAGAPTATIGPGPALRAARTKMNVEVREVADALNLPAHMIESIETNDFAAMPSLVFARGYVRAYAKLVELDPDAVVQIFSRASAPVVEPGTSGTGTTSTATLRVSDEATVAERLGALRTALENRVREKPLAALGILAGSMLLLMLLIWLLFGGSDAPATEAQPVAPSSESVPSAVLPNAGTQPPAQRGGFTEPVPISAERNNPGGVQASAPAPALAAADQVRLGDGDDRLRFTFVADCWVEVKDADGRVLYGDLGQSGKQLELIGQGPFSILLGYAPGAQLAFNGENVVLAPHTRNDVARLVLGQ